MDAHQLVQDGKEPNSLQRKLLFFPRWIEETYSINDGNILYTEEEEKYFRDLVEMHNIHLTQGQRNRYVLKRRSQKDKMKREYPSYLEEAFQVTAEGIYLQKEINLANLQ